MGKARYEHLSDNTPIAEPIIVGKSFYVSAHPQEFGRLRGRISQTDGVGYPQILWNLENLLYILFN